MYYPFGKSSKVCNQEKIIKNLRSAGASSRFVGVRKEGPRASATRRNGAASSRLITSSRRSATSQSRLFGPGSHC